MYLEESWQASMKEIEELTKTVNIYFDSSMEFLQQQKEKALDGLIWKKSNIHYSIFFRLQDVENSLQELEAQDKEFNAWVAIDERIFCGKWFCCGD